MLFSQVYKIMVNKVTSERFRGAIAPIVPGSWQDDRKLFPVNSFTCCETFLIARGYSVCKQHGWICFYEILIVLGCKNVKLVYFSVSVFLGRCCSYCITSRS